MMGKQKNLYQIVTNSYNTIQKKAVMISFHSHNCLTINNLYRTGRVRKNISNYLSINM
jgi:hypothetical protein